jgi:hypothetical protein
MQQTEKLDIWAILELMGRQRIAGRVTDRVIAGSGFLQVDVPATTKNPSFTRLISPGSIYAINPVTEEVALVAAEQINEQPIQAWSLRDHIAKAYPQLVLNPAKESLMEQAESNEEYEPEDYDR